MPLASNTNKIDINVIIATVKYKNATWKESELFYRNGSTYHDFRKS